MMLFENRLVDDVINEAIFRFGLSFIPKDIRLVSCALRLKARNTAFSWLMRNRHFSGYDLVLRLKLVQIYAIGQIFRVQHNRMRTDELDFVHYGFHLAP